MADPRLILGRITAVNGASPGRASTISYTIAVHDPNVEGIFTLDRQAPAKRLPDEIDIQAYNVGDIVIGSVEANRVRWHFQELPAFADCPTLTPTAPIVLPEDPFRVPPITPYPNSTNYSVGAGSSPTPVVQPGIPEA
jgi:hypothetical protein